MDVLLVCSDGRSQKQGGYNIEQSIPFSPMWDIDECKGQDNGVSFRLTLKWSACGVNKLWGEGV